MPKVTVVMPVFQMAQNPSLQAAVRSIERQTLQDWELLLYDDGSSDGTLWELRRLAGANPRILVIRGQKNRGAGYARNVCIRAAKGRYIAIMDADDVSHPKRLKIQADFLDRHQEYALVGSNAWMMDSRGIWGMRKTEPEPGRRSFLNTLPFIHPSVMFRKEVLERLHGYAASPNVCRAEDYELLMRLYAAGYQGYNIQKPLLAYREDLQAYKKRKYRYRIQECAVRLEGFRKLGILRGHLRYVIKPLAAGLVPTGVMRKVRMRRFQIRKRMSEEKWIAEAKRLTRTRQAERPGKRIAVRAEFGSQTENVGKTGRAEFGSQTENVGKTGRAESRSQTNSGKDRQEDLWRKRLPDCGGCTATVR